MELVSLSDAPAHDPEQVPLPTGSLARFAGEDELRVANAGDAPVTLLAFLAPPFPPR